MKKIGTLSKSVVNHLYGILTAWHFWQSHNKIHSNLISFPHRNFKWLKLICRLQMFGFYKLARWTPCNMHSNIPLHVILPKLLLQVLIHLHSPKNTRERTCMNITRSHTHSLLQASTERKAKEYFVRSFCTS
jgi:hypothetical protein